MANKYTKTVIDIDEAVLLYESGMTQAEVAEELGLTQKIIWRCFRDAGVKSRVPKKRDQQGDKNHMWKGDDASYAAFHYRLKTLHVSPKKCEICGTTDNNRTYDWANLTGEYENPKDYKRMCRSCHWKYDKKHLNFKGATGGRRAELCQRK